MANKNFRNTYGIQDLRKLDLKKIKASFESNIVTNGNSCKNLEKLICKKTGSKFCVVCNNGTSALMMALIALKNQNKYKKINIIVPNINFVSISNIASLIGANLILCDVNHETGMIDISSLKKIIEKCKKKKIVPNFFVPIHYAGDVLDIKKIYNFCKKKNIKIIEDGCHSFGSRKIINKELIIVGQSKYSEMTTFSFHPVKNITTIEGGAITTNSQKIYNLLNYLRSHSLKKTNIADPYKMILPTLNFRMGEINAVIGENQIMELDNFKKIRNNLVNYYLKKLEKLQAYVEPVNFNNKDIFWHLFVIKINKKFSKHKLDFMKFLKKHKIASQIHYKPIFKHDIYNKNIIVNDCKYSEIFYQSQLTLPLHTQLEKKDIDFIVSKISLFFKKIKP
tara:strand:- start:551 stop:1732 length:1182 start_codon:yes stop_codon:yes gene_type:complete